MNNSLGTYPGSHLNRDTLINFDIVIIGTLHSVKTALNLN